MVSRPKSQIEIGKSGFGLIEVMLAACLMGFVATGAFYFYAKTRTHSVVLSSKTDCTTLTNAISNQIKSFDNSLIVRNWMVTSATRHEQTMPPRDPFCNNVNGRTAVCDPFPLFSTDRNGYVNMNDLRTYLNVRGAYTWVQSLYNRNGIAICSLSGRYPRGIELSPDELGRLIPGMATLPNWVDHFRLYIRELNTDCGVPSTSPRSKFSVVVSAYFKTPTTPLGSLETCQSQIGVAATIDSNTPAVQITRVYNGAGEDIQNGYCTDPRDFGGANDGRHRIMNFDFTMSEVGSLLLARQDFPVDSRTPAGSFFNAPDTRVLPAGAGTILPAPETISYNTPIQGTLRFGDLEDTGGLPNAGGPRTPSLTGFSFANVDASGNTSPTTPVRTFMVHTPTCPVPAASYCPNASPAEQNDGLCPLGCEGPPDPDCTNCWNTQGDKNIRPFDTCMKGPCPVGERAAQGCEQEDPMNHCVGTFYGDDCGNLTCPGALPQVCPAGVDTSLYWCGDNIPGQCITDCGLRGTKPNPAGFDTRDYDCNCVISDACGDTLLRGTGGNNGRITCFPDPPASIGSHRPGCNCDGIDYSTITCNEAVDDICINPADVTPRSCGPGQMGCSPCAPAPPPAAAPCNEPTISGVHSCADHDYLGDTTCDMRQVLISAAASCTTYTLTAEFFGHRHSGSALRVRMNMQGGAAAGPRRAVPRGPGFNLNESDNNIGPSANSHPGNPLNPLNSLVPSAFPAIIRGRVVNFTPNGFPTQTVVLQATPRARVTLTGSIYDIHDASIEVRWRVVPSSPPPPPP